MITNRIKNINITKYILLLVSALFFMSSPAKASESDLQTDNQLFAGGMYFTMAPIKAKELGSMLGMGVGGRLYFYLAHHHIRLGGMGSVLKRELSNGDRFQLGGGGILLHYCHRFSFFVLGLGFLVGGQAIRLEPVQQKNGDIFTTQRIKSASWLLTPQLDLTFYVSNKIQLFLLTEYRHPYFTNYLTGHTVQFYLGIHFSH